MLSGCSRGTTQARPCPRTLVPGHLPDGADRTERDPYVPGDGSAGWRVGQGFLEVTAGVRETVEFVDVEQATIDGKKAAVGYLAVEGDPPNAPEVIHWRRKTSCGTMHVAASSNAISPAELERVAGSLAEHEA